jgi:hypothetical protein
VSNLIGVIFVLTVRISGTTEIGKKTDFFTAETQRAQRFSKFFSAFSLRSLRLGGENLPYLSKFWLMKISSSDKPLEGRGATSRLPLPHS